ncbi:hypothetical protein GLAREA_09580 [Glarea lozoyensis ATCC 20868]|uniref:Uncharacterized protein n=1 Tax=Glarea lozoyensis (strain ATCC 20868 / MF5171) TaxID=1116229 RepID=S3CTV1_GLAL2|nr:uncharacterized protein GLAREA_09580 [Glarea lozoyensis ATCC 20868]EPE28459.1 hypothetical protein GLAREA_09580 [Glarea lozoyensis ATCC 20868]
MFPAFGLFNSSSAQGPTAVLIANRVRRTTRSSTIWLNLQPKWIASSAKLGMLRGRRLWLAVKSHTKPRGTEVRQRLVPEYKHSSDTFDTRITPVFFSSTESTALSFPVVAVVYWPRKFYHCGTENAKKLFGSRRRRYSFPPKDIYDGSTASFTPAVKSDEAARASRTQAPAPAEFPALTDMMLAYSVETATSFKEIDNFSLETGDDAGLSAYSYHGMIRFLHGMARSSRQQGPVACIV